MAEATTGRTRSKRSDGARTRAAILAEAARLASVEGLEGLTIGRLAAALRMSKSGLYAHFGSKVELQLATIDTADEVFRREVIALALAATPGRPQLLALCDAYVAHLRGRTFPGGCFFATAALEMGTRPGPVRDRIAEFQRMLVGLIVGFVTTAQERGELVGEDPRGLAFEINGQFLAANAGFNLSGDEGVLDLAVFVLHRRMGRVGHAIRRAPEESVLGVGDRPGNRLPDASSSRPEPRDA